MHLLTASEAAAAIASGDLSPVDLLQSLLQRIDTIDGDIKAWVYVDRDAALAEAATMAEEAKSGKLRGPLHGVPVALKDVFHAAGMPTIANSKTTDPTLYEQDSGVAKKFRDAGAIIVGKVSTVEFAGMGDPPTTGNPWNLEHTPGGSSSGSGAAVGARTIPVAIGTQTGGSNLRPAAFCGVVGFKGTWGRISRSGIYTVSWGLDHPGVIARSVQDLALVFSCISGPEAGDPTLLPDAPPPADLALAGMKAPRIGVVRDFFFEKSDPAMCEAIEARAADYAAAGAEVVEVHLPQVFYAHAAAHRLVMTPEASVVHYGRYAHRLYDMSERQRKGIEAFSLVPATYYLHAQRIRRQLYNELQSLFANVDVLMMPTAPGPAPLGHHTTGDASLLTPWTFIGYPAATLPAGMSPNDLPMGLQLVGPPGSDYDVLRAAGWCESVSGLLPPPPLYP